MLSDNMYYCHFSPYTQHRRPKGSGGYYVKCKMHGYRIISATAEGLKLKVKRDSKKKKKRRSKAELASDQRGKAAVMLMPGSQRACFCIYLTVCMLAFPKSTYGCIHSCNWLCMCIYLMLWIYVCLCTHANTIPLVCNSVRVCTFCGLLRGCCLCLPLYIFLACFSLLFLFTFCNLYNPPLFLTTE